MERTCSAGERRRDAPGVLGSVRELSIGHLTLLFTDLTGSTALFERIGDARAYAIVQEHFTAMERVLRRHDGALVKTMGDAIMATFSTVADAAAAAAEMIDENKKAHRHLDLGIKVGVHEGPCLAVRANDRMDFFGTTVNMAARLQAQAKAGEIVMTRETADRPDLRKLLGTFDRSEFEVALRGITLTQQLVRLRARE
jgi:class 3 adenylate cyclase